jgi:hypothetical protein
MPVARINNQLICFIHIPKTGGSSIEKYLSEHGLISFFRKIGPPLVPCSPHHFHAELLQKFFASDLFDWSFMVVRHPAERLLSQYRYQTRKPNLIRNNLSFSMWLRYVLARRRINPYYRDNHFRPQHEFEAFGAEVFHLEDGLEEPIKKLNSLVGLPEEMGAVWANQTKPRDVDVSPSDRDLIFRVYREDFIRYGYEM